MALELRLLRNLAESNTLVRGLALRGVVDAGETEIKSVQIFYSFDDVPDAKQRFAGTVAPGNTFAHDIDEYKRPIRYFAVGVTETGIKHVSDMKEAVQAVYTPTVFDRSVVTGVYTLFQYAYTATTAGGGIDEIANDGTNYYSYLLPGGMLADGESVMLVFPWSMTGIHSKIHKPFFGTTQIGELNTTDSGFGRTTVLMQRQGTSLRWSTEITLDGAADDIVNEVDLITGLDLDNNDYEIKYVINQDFGGELAINSGLGYKIPAPAESTTDYLTEDGGGFLFEDDGVTALYED